LDSDAAAIVARERRHVQDLPAIRLHISEHQALHVRCPTCQQVTAGVFPPKASSRRSTGRGCAP
jgi:hypothetical protein